MKMTCAVAVTLPLFGVLAAEPLCKDGMCPLPAAPEEAEFAVLSPVPESAVETIKPAPRLETLAGKTIALVGGSFMASVTHSELKNLILKEYPTAKVYLLGEIGWTLYSGDDYKEYYSQFPAHNTVMVDSRSTYQVIEHLVAHHRY